MSGRTQLPCGLVTFMFTDIEGSTRLARLLGPGYAAVLGEHRVVVRRALTGHGGTELCTEGDSFFVVFPDASAALRAGVDVQRALAAHTWPSPQATPRVRIGLHTGQATPVAGEYASAEVHRAARVAAAAHGGQVLCSAATVRHAALPDGAGLLDLGRHRLRGFDDVERLFQVVAPGLGRHFPRPRTARAPRHNLPTPLTRLIGRRTESAAVTALVRTHRLVTVLGPGGAGKTRLAQAVAHGLLNAYPQGVWLVDLAGVGEPVGVPAAVASALGLRPEPGRPVLDTLGEFVTKRRMLVVLDTCDAHPAAAATVALRLLSGPGLHLLATSREPLGTAGETLWRIPPLPVRAVTGTVPDAVALLAERVSAARGGRSVPPDEAADLHRVAARLDGQPLAIELAATRLRLLSAGQLAGRLDDPLTALDTERPVGRATAEGRHGSLAASLDWSYRTLSPPARTLLGGLSVFAGPVDLATVEWVGGAGALGPLSVLADKSLVDVVAGPSGARYRMSATTRSYAAGLLAGAGTEQAARGRHVAWSLRALHGVRVDADGQPRTLSLHALAPFVAEWREALTYCVTTGRARYGLWLAGGLSPWWREHGDSAEARSWLTRLWSRLAGAGERIRDAEIAEGFLVHAAHAADSAERIALLRRAEAAARRADDPALLVRAMAGRRVPLLEDGRVAEAERVCRDVIRRADRLGVVPAALPAIVGLAELLWQRGALDEAAELLGTARQIEAGQPQERGRRTVDMLLGLVALRRADLVAAHDHLVVALRSRMRFGFRGDAAQTVHAVAARCALGGDPATAAMLFGAGQAGQAGAGQAGQAGAFGDYWAEQQAALRASVGDAAFDPAYATGLQLDLDQAVAVALSVLHPDLERGSARFDADARTLG